MRGIPAAEVAGWEGDRVCLSPPLGSWTPATPGGLRRLRRCGAQTVGVVLPVSLLSPTQAIVYEGQDKNPEMCRVLLTHEIMCR